MIDIARNLQYYTQTFEHPSRSHIYLPDERISRHVRFAASLKLGAVITAGGGQQISRPGNVLLASTANASVLRHLHKSNTLT